MLFRDYVNKTFSEENRIQNDELDMLRKSELPCVVYGTGFRAKMLTEHLSANGITINSYSESSQFWREGKTFMGKAVVNAENLNQLYDTYNLVIGCSGASMADNIAVFLRNPTIGHVFFFEKFMIPCEISYEWVIKHLDELDETFKMLEDDESRTVFLSYIQSHVECLNTDIPPLWSLCRKAQYFNELYRFKNFPQHALLDGGGFVGDTAEAFLDFVADEVKPKAVYSFEPDEDNYSKIVTVAKRYNDIYAYNYALGETNGETFFEMGNLSMSKITSQSAGERIRVVSADTIIGDKQISFVKLDLEGGEMDALRGMKRIISEQMPFLAICVYHRTEDLITIPQYIRTLAKDNNRAVRYKYYLRHHDIQPHETVFYAVPV
ncbi:FkbM family methyltransferase [Schwartzia succinivorans]|jgi:FkbM family methyltransferase|uniref:Methyltransferase, FkbM family n=1 Tax=Schwartzia succinivorans DSM 10502 TaxID=1123243 RepID=A0A1M4XQ24_9FIRM|nr:FkbM family methyltransferase [Schwartzia succinivorans]SHE95599.1 methyltransferase, FkbM family [Schwartzia succinivorans DSM 10502]